MIGGIVEAKHIGVVTKVYRYIPKIFSFSGLLINILWHIEIRNRNSAVDYPETTV